VLVHAVEHLEVREVRWDAALVDLIEEFHSAGIVDHRDPPDAARRFRSSSAERVTPSFADPPLAAQLTLWQPG